MRHIVLLMFVIISNVHISRGYSILTHEAVIDALWDKNIVPLLKQRYPNATPGDIKDAHAYAYGGAITPDMGYYPRGSKLFTNLTHYVRSGDLVMAMLEEAVTINEYAFALGWLAHYNSDNFGHSIGVNRSVPIIFPKLRTKFGDTVTYSQDRVSHVRTELSFDVVQTVKGNYNTEAYHDYIGFKLADSLLKRAFVKTYGLEIEDVVPHFSKAVNTFRWCVKDVFPQLTRTAWKHKKKEILQSRPTATRRNYVYRMRRADYMREFDKDYAKRSFSVKAIAAVIRFLPKIGPLKKLKIVVPSPEAEKLFVQSFDTVVVHYAASLSNTNSIFVNKDFDTGKKTMADEYDIADDTYADLLLKLKEKNFANVSTDLKNNISSFYAGSRGHLAMQRHAERSGEINAALGQLQMADNMQ